MKNEPMQRDAYLNLVIGFLSGAVVCLVIIVCLLLFTNNPVQAFAQSGMSSDSKESVVVGSAPTTPGGNPFIWVLYQRPFNENDKGILGLTDPKGIKRMTLCCYSTHITGAAVKLVGIRDITFDIQLVTKQGLESATVENMRNDYLQLLKQIEVRKTGGKDKNPDDTKGQGG